MCESQEFLMMNKGVCVCGSLCRLSPIYLPVKFLIRWFSIPRIRDLMSFLLFRRRNDIFNKRIFTRRLIRIRPSHDSN